MFAKRQLNVIDWLLFHLLMIIPIINIIIIILLIISPSTNPTLKSYIWFWLILLVLGAGIGIRFITRFIQNIQTMF